MRDVRVTKKSDMRTWSNARGEGNLFSVDLLDEDGSEVKGTFFKQDADKWIQVLQEGNVYSFCGGRVKVGLRSCGLAFQRVDPPRNERVAEIVVGLYCWMGRITDCSSSSRLKSLTF